MSSTKHTETTLGLLRKYRRQDCRSDATRSTKTASLLD